MENGFCSRELSFPGLQPECCLSGAQWLGSVGGSAEREGRGLAKCGHRRWRLRWAGGVVEGSGGRAECGPNAEVRKGEVSCG